MSPRRGLAIILLIGTLFSCGKNDEVIVKVKLEAGDLMLWDSSQSHRI